MDIEPDKTEQRIKNTVFSGCQFIDNVGDGIEVFLAHTTDESDAVTLRFENCYISSKHGTGIRVTKIGDNGPDGSIEFDNCTVENTVGYGIKVQEKSLKGARVRFTNCKVIHAASDRQFGGEWSPISLSLPKPEFVQTMGGIDFIDCFVEDNRDRPAIEFTQPESDFPLHDITGTITVLNANGVRAELGKYSEKLPLVVTEYQ